jgi:nucleoside-diphosphate-sugar epimerase
MRILITGAAGNLGAFLTEHLLPSEHQLRTLIHQRDLRAELAAAGNVEIKRANLADRSSLAGICSGVDTVVHLAGVLFRPWPERFLYTTNVTYVQNIIDAALEAQVGKFIIISFPHVEGESDPEHRATGSTQGNPGSLHARTRLEAEQRLFRASEGTTMSAVALRAGMIYADGVLMIEAARWLMARRLLGVWRRPTWVHLLALPDFLTAVRSAIETPGVQGVFNLGDEAPLSLQTFLDTLAGHWGYPRPWRAPEWVFYTAAWTCELLATLFRTAAPLTRDFVRIGMASYVSDLTRMKAILLPHLAYPTLQDGLDLLSIQV